MPRKHPRCYPRRGVQISFVARQLLALTATAIVTFSPGVGRLGTAHAQGEAGSALPDAGASKSPAPAAPAAEPLRVVAAGSAPFVSKGRQGQPVGMSVALWEEIAQGLGRDFEYQLVDNVSQALERVERGQADIAVGPISITAERAQQVDFSQPYFEASLAILAPARTSSLSRIKPFLTTAFLSGLGVLLLVLCGVGTLMWLAERRVNPEEFPSHWRKGIPEGLWMALVTMTTVGYGDRVPRSRAGRALTGAWMLVSLVITSSLVAFVATAVTLAQLDEPAISTISQLRGQPVAVVGNTTSEDFARKNGARPVPVDSLATAVEEVEQGSVDALLFDRPSLRYYLSQHPKIELSLSQASYLPTGYGFALPRNEDELRSAVNLEILRLREQGRLAALADRWIGAN